MGIGGSRFKTKKAEGNLSSAFLFVLISLEYYQYGELE
jgi:hypothetical protein